MNEEEFRSKTLAPPPPDEKDRLLEACERLLKMNADQFRHYEQLHAAKGTADAIEKSKINAHWAGLNESLLEHLKVRTKWPSM